MAKIYYDKDADISLLEGKTLGIIGYGNQGRAQTLNMKDSGFTSILIATARDETYEKAEKNGFQLTEIKNTTRQSDILFLPIPDEIMPQVYEEHVAPNLRPGMVLNFATGYNITFRQIVPPDHVDVIMVAPRMIGDGVRNLFLEKKGDPAFIAVEQNASGSAREWKEEQEKGMPEFKRLVKDAMESEISRLEEDLINNS